jgi:hypothetical protein
MKINDETPYTNIPNSHRTNETICVRSLLENNKIENCCKVVEFFGGMGLLSSVFQEILKPIEHVMCELNPDLYDFLLEKFPQCRILYGNAFELIPPEVELNCFLSVDFNRWTVLNLLKQSDDKFNVLKKIANKPRIIHITDSCSMRLHLNKYTYAKHLGKPIETMYDYVLAASEKYKEIFDWTLIDYEYHYGALHQLFAGSV